ncbi:MULTISPECIES: surface-adhesin E family protein [Cupriavidus]
MSLRTAFHAAFHAAILLGGSSLCLAAHAEGAAVPRHPAAAGLYQCPGPDGGTVFRATPRDGCTVVAAPDPAAPDPQRWLPLMGANGLISYFDKTSVRRRGAEVGVAVMRNAPAGVIRTTSGEQIRSSLKRMIFNCATSMYAVVEQTLYAKRNARGESLYTINAPQAGMPQQVATGTVAGELFSHLCH